MRGGGAPTNQTERLTFNTTPQYLIILLSCFRARMSASAAADIFRSLFPALYSAKLAKVLGECLRRRRGREERRLSFLGK